MMEASTAHQAREFPVSDEARELCSLARIDYEDGHAVPTARAQDLTAEQWARTLLEGAPGAVRQTLRAGWASLGLQLGPADDHERVLGWRLRRTEDDFALLGADATSLGLNGEVLVMRDHDAVMIATFLQLDGPVARGAWMPIAPGHRKVVRRLLEQGVRRAESD